LVRGKSDPLKVRNALKADPAKMNFAFCHLSGQDFSFDADLTGGGEKSLLVCVQTEHCCQSLMLVCFRAYLFEILPVSRRTRALRGSSAGIAFIHSLQMLPYYFPSQPFIQSK
jgi:hypothetical protein